MAPKFGTSGLRGLVVELTPALIADHIRSFVRACPTGGRLFIGQDLRPSSPRIADDVASAVIAEGLDVVDCGALPTPALALAAFAGGGAAVMVTGSHIPADRNGLKFYTPKGEITKADEEAIRAGLGQATAKVMPGRYSKDIGAGASYIQRYIQAFGTTALSGKTIGLYTHSAVGRDGLAEILSGLGAEVVELGRSNHFIPVDTEAVDPSVARQIHAWVEDLSLDALVSTDGDADRPLLADDTGHVVPGDILGQITAGLLGAEIVVTPVTSNSGVERKGFDQVIRTKVGSPFVIAGMKSADGRVAGYEANGGFLLGYCAQCAAGPLAALATRDAALPILAVLVAAGPGRVSDRVAAEPPIVKMTDRLQDIPPEKSHTFLNVLHQDPSARAAFLSSIGAAPEVAYDNTDGLRLTLADNCSVHLRPSGNAPEFRVYTEADTPTNASKLLQSGLQVIADRLV